MLAPEVNKSGESPQAAIGRPGVGYNARAMARAALSTLVLAAWIAPASAIAAEPAEEAELVSGIETPAQHADDAGRDFANVLLFVPRHVADFLFWGTSVAVAVLENQQVVPRVQGFVSTPGGRLAVLPTLFVETGGVFSIGARMIADLGPVATGLRLGFGGVHSFEIEPRMTFRLEVPLSTINVEGLYKQDNDLEYLGIGQTPERDPRNRFQPGQRGAEAQYFEERARWILGYAVRPAEVLELLASVSLDWRNVSDAYDADVVLSDVFVPGTVVGPLEPYRMLFAETAVRVDTRGTRGRPSAGFLGEAYAGGGRDTRGGDIDLVRYGGRLAGFFPIYRTTNILSPRVVLDGVAPLYDTALPFTELTGQPDFRGLDTRRDLLSLVGSLEYRWLIVESVGMRLFGDTAVVAPDFENIDFAALRWALGMALDLHTNDSEIGQLGFSAAPDGVRLLFSLGVSTSYGDRQHRE